MVGWGIIGVGDVTEVKAGPPVWRVPGSRLVHVMRRDAERARDYAVRHDVPRWSADADALLADPEVDAVYVATPTASHAELAVAAARAGKHVLVEKPMAMDDAECDAMVAACADAGVRLWVAYYRRALPRFTALRDLLDAGEIGTVRAVTWTLRQRRDEVGGWRWDPRENRHGEFFEAGCHGLDLLDQLFGPASDPRGSVTPDARAGLAAWRHGEVLASASWAYTPEEPADELRIVGDEGSATCSVFAPVPLTLRSLDGRTTEHAIPDPAHVHGPLVASIVDELHGRGRCPSTGESARRTNRLLGAIMAAADEGDRQTVG